MTPNKYLKNRPLIYGIRNLTNGKLYVGKTTCIYKRCSQYLYDFKTGRLGHLNDYLLNAMRKVGIEKFEMFVLEFCELEVLNVNELKWIENFNTLNRNYGYNLRLDSSTGLITNAETSIKMSNNLKNQWSSGVRKDHSEKLKKSWAEASPLRRKEQSQRFAQIRTKYDYSITYPNGLIETPVTYLKLKTLGIKSALGNMCRSGLNFTNCNGYYVTRKPKGE